MDEKRRISRDRQPFFSFFLMHGVFGKKRPVSTGIVSALSYFATTYSLGLSVVNEQRISRKSLSFFSSFSRTFLERKLIFLHTTVWYIAKYQVSYWSK